MTRKEAQALIRKKEQEGKEKAQHKMNWMLQKHIQDNIKALY
jgi:hypothetical protein